MKRYEDYKQDYFNTVVEAVKKGDAYVLKEDWYIMLHFFEDNGIEGPWEHNKIDEVLSQYSIDEHLCFLNDIIKATESLLAMYNE